MMLLRRAYTTSSHSITTQLFKDVMSSIASQTMILTAPTSTNSQDKYKGATLSSVTSLSTNPYPLIQFNLQKPSRTSNLLHEFKRFGIHILSPSTQSMEMAKLFSRARILNNDTNQWEMFHPFEQIEQGVDYRVVKGAGYDLPVLNRGVEKVLICEKYAQFDVQDHEIWIGKVVEVVDQSMQGKSNGTQSDCKTGGLLNFNRGFYKIGEGI